jgi:hypothetical protein
VAAAARAFGVLLSWYYQPYFATGNRARFRVDPEPVVDQGRQVRFAGFPPTSVLNEFCSSVSGGLPTSSPVGAFAQCLSRHGYTQWTSYQPASRFWPFQWIEGGWLLALSVLLIAATVWLARLRAT